MVSALPSARVEQSRVRVVAGDILVCLGGGARQLVFTLTVPLSTKVYKWGPTNLMLGVTLGWTSIPFKGSRITPSCFMLQKPEISNSLMGHLARIQTHTYTLN